MPLYDYRCTACDEEVEVMHGIHGTGPETCEACGGPMRKALSPPAIHFKGSGWAKKDAAAATSKKAKSKGGSSAGAPNDSSSSGGDANAKSTDGDAKSGVKSGAKSTTSDSAKASPSAGSKSD